MSPHGGALYYSRALRGIIDALLVRKGVISTYPDALMGLRLSVKRRVFVTPLGTPLVTLTGTPLVTLTVTPVGTPLLSPTGTLTGTPLGTPLGTPPSKPLAGFCFFFRQRAQCLSGFRNFLHLFSKKSLQRWARYTLSKSSKAQRRRKQPTQPIHIMKLTYWTIECINDAHCYNIRSKTKKGAIEALLSGDFDPTEYADEVCRITLEYKDAFDLLDGAFSEEREDANLIDVKRYSIAHRK